MDEKELLRQLQEQRAGALETAIAQYGAYVLAVIRNRSRGVLTPEDHEEIASDVFLALWRGAKNITRGQLRPWLGAVARKQTAEAMRKKNVYLPLEDDALITLDRLWEQMVEKERCEALAQALAAPLSTFEPSAVSWEACLARILKVVDLLEGGSYG